MSQKESGCLSFLLFCSRNKSKNRSQSPRALKSEANEKTSQTQHLVQRSKDPAGVNYTVHKSHIVVRDNHGFVLQSPRHKPGIESYNINKEKKESNLQSLPKVQEEDKIDQENGKLIISHIQSLSPFRMANDNSRPKIVAITPRVIAGRYLSNSRSLKEKLN